MRPGLIAGAAFTAGCGGPQSSLDPAGPDAQRVFDLFIVMMIGSAIIWLIVVGLSFYATRLRPAVQHPKLTHSLIIGESRVTTWPTDAWQIGGGTVWGWMSYDPELRKVLLRPQRNGFVYVIDRQTGEVLSAEVLAHVTRATGFDLIPCSR